ncbi:MAG TPA: chemotaxis protein CheA [Rhodocyclaceae bacterium]|nr:chemotaxis protein CheA [Rhodocyclaceae bacterium]HMY50160.1 chemotaxis protein CheA [Rhodocyclaceae bacterium]HNB65388.1 chemotaxis protein CheA [Rhodocyclaceae bacterium]HNI82648.1 chemotaxis protein CheA [Rhodocyclaceae bacterium]
MSIQLDDALQTFIVESRELLQQMEEALLEMEHGTDDPDTLNAIFRAAHTIKGSAGLFGLDDIVAFTHNVESLLDRIRDHRLALTRSIGGLLLESSDHMGALVSCAAAGEAPDLGLRARSEVLGQRLKEVMNGGTATPASANATAPAGSAVAEVDADLAALDWPDGQDLPAVATSVRSDGVSSGLWHISLRAGPDLLRNGMDPLSILHYLSTLGQIVSLEMVLGALPPLTMIDPESCYLGFELSFASAAGRDSIDGAFDFVREDSIVRVIEPYGSLDDYRALLGALPEDRQLLGEMLVQCGSLTRDELAQALATRDRQAADSAVAGDPAPRLGEVLVQQQLVDAPLVEAAVERQQQLRGQGTAKGGEASLIRVDAAKLDQLINLIGELIIAGAGTQLIARRLKVPELAEASELLSRLVESVRDSALDLRMVQIGATFNRFRRVVRDVAAELGKDIELDIRGGDTELDKTVVERIGDPLTHIVRNALDHGIEPAAQRVAAGKSAQGRLSLNAYHDSGSIVIEVSDDGGGLRKERILRKAIERGLVAEGQTLSDKEIFHLVFEPGFSTAEQVSNLSGRGVGMDVVKRNIQALRGTVDLESSEGQGTTVRIRLPLTLAIIDGFLIGAGPSSYVVPLDQVVECIELPAGESPEHGASYLNLRGEVLPFIRLRDLFGTGGEAPRRENVVVVQYAGERAGLVVDQLYGEFQTVIKPLGKVFSHIRCIGGSTILGSGEVALIIDVPGLVRQVSTRHSAAKNAPLSMLPA